MKAYDTLWGYCAADQWLANFTRLHRTSCDSLFSLARGMPGLLRCTCGDYARVLCFISHARLWVHWAPGIPCALCSQRRERFLQNLGRLAPRECGGVACHSGAMRSIEPGISRFPDVRLHI